MHWLSDGFFHLILNVLACFLPSKQFGLQPNSEVLQSVVVDCLPRQVFDSLLQNLFMFI